MGVGVAVEVEVEIVVGVNVEVVVWFAEKQSKLKKVDNREEGSSGAAGISTSEMRTSKKLHSRPPKVFLAANEMQDLTWFRVQSLTQDCGALEGSWRVEKSLWGFCSSNSPTVPQDGVEVGDEVEVLVTGGRKVTVTVDEEMGVDVGLIGGE